MVAAVDLGASSGRVMLGRVGPDELRLDAVHRFPNDPVRTLDGLHWNILELYRNVLLGLRQAYAAEPGLASIGIDSWAVDYAAGPPTDACSPTRTTTGTSGPRTV